LLLLRSGVLIAIITFGSPLPALLEADRLGDIKVGVGTGSTGDNRFDSSNKGR
jgi:hypothetical protein